MNYDNPLGTLAVNFIKTKQKRLVTLYDILSLESVYFVNYTIKQPSWVLGQIVLNWFDRSLSVLQEWWSFSGFDTIIQTLFDTFHDAIPDPISVFTPPYLSLFQPLPKLKQQWYHVN